MIGTTIGNFRMVERLGEGGMGTVYRAVDEMLDREVAIKVLRPELLRQGALIERFRQEAIALARLNHPRIATLHGLERSGDNFLMVMEYVRGDTLEAIVQRSGPLQWTRAAELMSAVLDALDHAHDRGVVHRDIKPANVMLASSGAVKVMDFGIARVLGKNRQTQFGHAVGTPTYMAPEQLRGEEVDGRTDLYAVGAVLFELVTGHMAFEADSDYSLMMQQLNEPPPVASSIVPEVPVAVDQIIQRAMSKKREDRFPGAMAFREALDRARDAYGNRSRQATAPATRLGTDIARPLVPDGPGMTADYRAAARSPVADTRLADLPPAAPQPPSPAARETRLASDPPVAATRLASEPRVPGTRLAEPLASAPRVQPANGERWTRDWRTYVAVAAVLAATGTAIRVFGRGEPVTVPAAADSARDDGPTVLVPGDPEEAPSPTPVVALPSQSPAPVPSPVSSSNVATPVPSTSGSAPRQDREAAPTPTEPTVGPKRDSPPASTGGPSPVTPRPADEKPGPVKLADRTAGEESSAGVQSALVALAGSVRERRADAGALIRDNDAAARKWAELVREGRLAIRMEGAPEIQMRDAQATATFDASLTIRSPFGATKERRARFSAELERSGGAWRVVSLRPLGELNLK